MKNLVMVRLKGASTQLLYAISSIILVIAAVSIFWHLLTTEFPTFRRFLDRCSKRLVWFRCIFVVFPAVLALLALFLGSLCEGFRVVEKFPQVLLVFFFNIHVYFWLLDW